MTTTDDRTECKPLAAGSGALPIPFLTVFTPTYNRAHTLPRVYESLKNQTSRNFEWIVIDDGSSDATESLVTGWIARTDFAIRYLRQENAGKHIAWNRALELARGHYFTCLDSDDAFVPHTVETLESDLMEKFGSRDTIDGRAFLLMDPAGNPYGDEIAKSDFLKPFTRLVFEKKVRTDVWMVFRTEIACKFPFPENFRKVYFPEGWIIRNFDRQYPIRFAHNQRLGIYYQVTDSLSNSAAVSLRKLKTGSGLTLYLMHLSVLNHIRGHFLSNPMTFVKSAMNYTRFRCWSGQGLGPYILEIEPLEGKVIAFFGMVPGLLLTLVDRIRIALSSPPA